MHTSTFRLRRAARSAGLVTVGVLSTLGALSLTHIGPALAQSPGVNLAQLVAEVNALKTQQVADDATIAALKGTPVPGPKGDQGATGAQGLQGPKGSTGLQGPMGLTGKAGSTGKDGEQGIPGQDGAQGIQGLTGAVGLTGFTGPGGPAGPGFTPDKIAILNAFTLSDGVGTGTELTLTRVNLHLVNGLNSTQTTNGLGNLIVGYNELNPAFHQARNGSHNLIVGDDNNYTYYGGIVAGQNNAVTAPYACVVGGVSNVADGSCACVSGGESNTAVGFCASVSGGNSNTASGIDSSVSGGAHNSASGRNVSGTSDASSISGGRNRNQAASYGWTAGSEANSDNTTGIVVNQVGNFRSP